MLVVVVKTAGCIEALQLAELESGGEARGHTRNKPEPQPQPQAAISAPQTSVDFSQTGSEAVDTSSSQRALTSLSENNIFCTRAVYF